MGGLLSPSIQLDKKKTDGEVESIIRCFEEHLKERTFHHLGYPYNLEYNFGCLSVLQNYSINNLGDPFIESNYGVHSREFEVAVCNWFAGLWELPSEEMYGYCTNCGTEGNFFGILLGRENFPNGILYASRDSHYSVFKAAHMFKIDAHRIASYDHGEIDYDDLQQHLQANKGRPAIININIGTTVKGAIDNIDKVLSALKSSGYTEEEFFIHCDGALFGMMIPFMDGIKCPKIDFKKPIGSISVSGHKFVGSCIPCGVVITRNRYIVPLSKDVEYLNSRDTTIMGSRNGHTPIYMWYTLATKDIDDIKADVQRCIDNAEYLKSRLCSLGVKCLLNDYSSTVVFERPSVEIVKKWQLACEGSYAHVVVMPNVTKEKLDLFVTEIGNYRLKLAHDLSTSINPEYNVQDNIHETE